MAYLLSVLPPPGQEGYAPTYREDTPFRFFHILRDTALQTLDGQVRVGVIEGDIHTSLDAERLARFGGPVVQINTDPLFGGECHLDAWMVRNALPALSPAGLYIVLIENVGNLVCPAEFWVGENRKRSPARQILLSRKPRVSWLPYSAGSRCMPGVRAASGGCR